jgi:hypothetical protein
MIAKNLYSHVNLEGHKSYSIMSEIIDHKSNGSAMSKDDGYETTRDGIKCPRQTTKGWKLLVNLERWHLVLGSAQGSTKGGLPCPGSRICSGHKILEQPAFAWWAQHSILKKRDQIIQKVKSRYWA